MKWDTVSFDCYGTLVDWETGIGEAFCSAAARDGVQLERAEVLAAYHEIEPAVEAGAFRPYREVLRETARQVAERLGWPLRSEQAHFLADSLRDWPLFDDTRTALERLKSRYQLAVLSNVDEDLLEGTLQRIGVRFDWTVTAELTRSYKPAFAHFEEAVRRVGGDASRLLHAAQSLFHDVRPATELGLATVWVNRGRQILTVDLTPRHVVHDLEELADWLNA